MHEIRRRALPAIIPVLCTGAIGYFGYHAMEGERGLNAYTRLNQAIAESKAILADTTAERRRMEQKVALLRTEGLDADMLDELARGSLGLMRPDEVVIYNAPPTGKTTPAR